MISTRQVSEKTVCVIVGDKILGTAFFYHHNEKEYLVTARHLAEKLPPGKMVRFRSDTIDITTIPVIRYHQNPKIDISVLKLVERAISSPLDVIHSNTVGLGQDVFILGYPLGYYSSSDIPETNQSHIAWINKGVFSGAKQKDNTALCFADIQVNPGFSGGPVFCFDEVNSTNSPQILGVVSSYISPRRNIVSAEGEKQELYFDENSGITCYYSIKHVQEIISTNDLLQQLE